MHFQTTVDDKNKFLVLLHGLTVPLFTVIFLAYLLPGLPTLLFQWSGKTLIYCILCQAQHQSNIAAQTYLILTTSFWHWFTFKEKSCFKLKKTNICTKWANGLPWCIQKERQCATLMVTSLFTHIVHSEEKIAGV